MLLHVHHHNEALPVVAMVKLVHAGMLFSLATTFLTRQRVQHGSVARHQEAWNALWTSMS